MRNSQQIQPGTTPKTQAESPTPPMTYTVGRLGNARILRLKQVVTMVGLAKSLNITTIIEGVETKEDLDFLREIGCTEIQGYLISPAATALAVHGLLMKFGGSNIQLIKPAELRPRQKREA